MLLENVINYNTSKLFDKESFVVLPILPRYYHDLCFPAEIEDSCSRFTVAAESVKSLSTAIDTKNNNIIDD